MSAWSSRLVWVVYLLGIAIGIALGLWQLDRAGQKRAIRDAMQARVALPVIDASGWAPDIDARGEIHRRAVVRGEWLSDQTVFWDNRSMNGAAGFIVVTPLRLASGAVLLVQRGWVPRDPRDRFALPKLEQPAGPVALEGSIASFPSKRIELGRGEEGAIRQNIVPEGFRLPAGSRLLTVSFVQGGRDPGLLRDWPVPGDGIDKHLGYAFQWFTLSGLIAAYAFGLQIARRFRRSRAP